MKRKILNNGQTVKMLVVIALLSIQHIAHSQVFTRILSEGEKIYDYIPWYFLHTPMPKASRRLMYNPSSNRMHSTAQLLQGLG